MDFLKTIQQLLDERSRIDHKIAKLQAQFEREAREPRRKRGRPKMSAEERYAVSLRMRSYWEARRGTAQEKETSGG